MLPGKVLIVDCNAVCYAAYFGLAKLRTHGGSGMEVIYGFFSQLQIACRVLGVAHLAFCWDSRRSRRKAFFPKYKDKRHSKPEPDRELALIQFRQLHRQILPELGFKNNFLSVGFEADDLIASICLNHPPKQGQQYYILSSDQDLYQLLTDNIAIYTVGVRKILYTKQDFCSQFKILPEQWAQVKAIAGCSTDKVPGIYGIGEKRACGYLLGDKKYADKIESKEGRAIIARNDRLVRLPFKNTPALKLDWSSLPSYSAWLEVCERLEFASFLREPDTWESIFSGTPPLDILDKIRIGGRTRRDI